MSIRLDGHRAGRPPEKESGNIDTGNIRVLRSGNYFEVEEHNNRS